MKRDDFIVDIERFVTRNLPVGYLITDTTPALARSVVKGITNATKERNSFWNVWEWTAQDK